MRETTRESLRLAGLMALLAAMTAGCAESSWEAVQRRDTVGSYHQFLRDHPNSMHADEAREHLAFLRVKNLPTFEGFEEFKGLYPNGRLLPELRAVVEPLFFEEARRKNTPAAYREFLELYPNGNLTERARGNLFYVDNVRNSPTTASLQGFVELHSESDFLSEAKRTLELIEFQRSTAIRKLGIRVEVAPNVVQAERVRRGFGAVVARRYREVGIEVVRIPPGEGAPPDADAWMRIDYHEAPASGTFGGRTIVSHCRLRLYHRDREEPVWDRKFEAPADHELKGAYGRDKTVFGNSKYRFWERFFVPVSTWAVSESRVTSMDWVEEVLAIDVEGERAVLLLERGGVDYLDISSPLEPKVVDRYRRQSDLTRWDGIEIIDDRTTLIYGADGAELLLEGELQVDRLGRWDVGEIGEIRGAVAYDDQTVLLASSNGLYAIRLNQRPLTPHRLLDSEYVGVWAKHPWVYAVSPARVEVASPKHLLRHLTATKMPLGKKFRAHRVRVVNDSLFVFGKTHIAEISLEDPQHPKAVTLLDPEDTGKVADLSADGGHVYLLGSRGLQVAGPGAKWISDTIQVRGDTALQRKGRFAFLVGNKTLEVVDLAPYLTAAAAPAATQ